ncbi:schlafen-like protein 1 [Dysidea avara]|uniref:schlafen-like protein 1 n=1 Tax=Dysidea avara TaxID=196820 RepID=UPI0033253246
MSSSAQLATPSTGGMEYFITPEAPYTPSDPNYWGSTGLGPPVRIGTVMPLTESRNVEFKKGGALYSQRNMKEQICRYGSAFLNSGGGVMYFGVLDNGVIEGITLSTHQIDRIAKQIEDIFLQFDPCVSKEFYELSFTPCNIYGMYVVGLSVRAGKEDEVYSDAFSKMYIKRDGSIHGPLWPRDIKEIVLDKLEIKYKNQQQQSKTSS